MSQAIIGGAEGPTSVFVTSSINWTLLIGIAVIIIGVVIFFVLKRRK